MVTDVIERAEAALRDASSYWQPAAFGSGCLTLMPELIAALKDARAAVRSHQETVMHANDALGIVQGECRRQLDLNHFAANALQTAQTRDPGQNWQSLIERLRGERQWLGEMQ